MNNEPDFAPDPADVLQVEAEEPAVRVRVEGPTRTQSLPRQSAGIRGLSVSDTVPVRLLTADPHRAQATVIANTHHLYVAGSKQEVAGGQPGQLPPDVPVVFGAADELWGMCAVAATTMTVTVIQERWADG